MPQGQIGSKIKVKIPLDELGYIQGTISGPTVFIWPTDQMVGEMAYKVTAYSSRGQLSWGPHYQKIPTQNVPHNIDLGWIPNPKD